MYIIFPSGRLFVLYSLSIARIGGPNSSKPIPFTNMFPKPNWDNISRESFISSPLEVEKTMIQKNHFLQRKPKFSMWNFEKNKFTTERKNFSAYVLKHFYRKKSGFCAICMNMIHSVCVVLNSPLWFASSSSSCMLQMYIANSQPDKDIFVDGIPQKGGCNLWQ